MKQKTDDIFWWWKLFDKKDSESIKSNGTTVPVEVGEVTEVPKGGFAQAADEALREIEQMFTE